jgi:hypothetical protein
MLKWLIIGLVLFLLYRWIIRVPRYGRLFSPEHLREVAGGLERALPVALEYVGKPPPSDPFAAGSAFMTSADIAVFYTIAKSDGGGFEHHLSMSYKGGSFARAAGGFLGAAMGRLLRVPSQKGVLALSTSGVYHYLAPLSASEHAELLARGIEKLDDDAAARLVRQAMDDRPELLARLGRIDVGEGKR